MESTFGKKLKAARKLRSMVQKALGDRIGVGQVTIANYEKGVRFPGEETLKSLAEALNVSLDYLMSVNVPQNSDLKKLPGDTPITFTVDILFEKMLDSSAEPGKEYLYDWQHSCGFSLQETFDLILIPLLIEVGERWTRGEISVAEEHLVSAKIREFIVLLGSEAITGREPLPKNGKVWIGFAAPGEEHDMVLLMISQLMILQGWDAVFLGTGVPLPALLEAVDRYKPDAIATSITLERNRNGLEAYISSVLPVLKPDCKVIIGGRGLSRFNNDAFPGIFGIADSIYDAITMAEE